MQMPPDAIRRLILEAGFRPDVTLRRVPVRAARAARDLTGRADVASTAPPVPDAGAGGIRWILATDQPARVFDWQRGDFVDEVLLTEGLEFPDQLPLLDAHSRESVANQIGSVRDFRFTTSGGFRALEGLVSFSEADDLSRATAAKVREGHITDGSIGYRVDRSVWIPDGERAHVAGRDFQGPVKVSYRAALKEFSVCPIGADSLAKVRALLRGEPSIF